MTSDVNSLCSWVAVVFLFQLGAFSAAFAGANSAAGAKAIGEGIQYADDRVIVKFRSGSRFNSQSINSNMILGPVELTVLHSLPLSGALVGKFDNASFTTEEVVNSILKLSAAEPSLGIEYAEPDYVFWAAEAPNDTYLHQQWALTQIEAIRGWRVNNAAPDFVIAVIDSGVDYRHEDLADNLWMNPGEGAQPNGIDDDGNGIVDDIYGASFTNHQVSGDPFDDLGHGTHVTGTIGAVTDNVVGVAGVAWKARIMAVKFISGKGWGYSSDAERAIHYAISKKALVLNNSWGGGGYSQSLRNAIRRAGRSGSLFVVAAGNDEKNIDAAPVYPASYDEENVFVVMSSDWFDDRSGFSNFGVTSVDIAAPGSQILSTIPGNGYDEYWGTSMATPHVAGAAALLFAIRPAWDFRAVKSHLMVTAVPVPALEGLSQTGGRLDLGTAIGGPIRFERPIFSDNWLPGDTTEVAWSSTHPTENCTRLNLALSRDDGATFEYELANGISNSGAHLVEVPLLSSRNVRLRATCQDSELRSISERFTLYQTLDVTRPKQDDRMWSGRRKKIKWSGSIDNYGPPGCETISFSMSIDGGETFPHVLESSVRNSGKAIVDIPHVSAAETVIRAECNEVEDFDDSASFKLVNKKAFWIGGLVGIIAIAAAL